MALGALICYLVAPLISASSRYGMLYRPGTFLFAIGDIFFLVAPVVVWMMFRGHGSRHSLEMAGAMAVPVAAIIVFGWLAAYDSPTWLLTGGYPVMCLGILVYMLYRRGHFTREAARLMHTAGPEAQS